MSTQPHVLIVGGTSLDTIIHLPHLPRPEPQTLWADASYQALGGTGAGKALNLVRLGFQVTLHTQLGQDHPGQLVRAALEQEDIELLITPVSAPTEQHVNLMTPAGERISIYTHPPIVPPEIDWQPVQRALEMAHIAAISILDYTRPALSLARQAKVPVWIDLHDYRAGSTYHQEFIDQADVLFLASDCLPDYRAFMQQQIEAGKQLVVCTHGKRGSTALDSFGRWYEQGIIEGLRVVDANGAGDAFFSGFLFAYLRQQDIQTCLRYGTISAGLCIGARSLAADSLSQQYLEELYLRAF